MKFAARSCIVRLEEHFMRSLRTLIAGAVLACSVTCAEHASASTLVYSTSFDHWPGPYEGGAAPLSAIWPQFNPAWGTLTGVEYDIAGLMHYYVTKLTDGQVSIYYSLSSGLTLNGDGLSYRSPGATASFDGIYNWSLGSPDFTTAPSLALAPVGTTITRDLDVDITRMPDLGLGPFIGTGTVTLTISRSMDDVCYRIDGQPSVGCGSSGYSTAAMTYTYDPAQHDAGVPEPASAAMLLAGVLGLRLIKRI
jgi:hypothetical protein